MPRRDDRAEKNGVQHSPSRRETTRTDYQTSFALVPRISEPILNPAMSKMSCYCCRRHRSSVSSAPQLSIYALASRSKFIGFSHARKASGVRKPEAGSIVDNSPRSRGPHRRSRLLGRVCRSRPASSVAGHMQSRRKYMGTRKSGGGGRWGFEADLGGVAAGRFT